VKEGKVGVFEHAAPAVAAARGHGTATVACVSSLIFKAPRSGGQLGLAGSSASRISFPLWLYGYAHRKQKAFGAASLIKLLICTERSVAVCKSLTFPVAAASASARGNTACSREVCMDNRMHPAFQGQ
jgi:hypothetical protein